jgi:pentatricopeptide repeat protein
LKKAIEVRPDDSQVKGALANALTRAGEWEEAKQIFESLANGESNFVFNELLEAIVKTGHVAEAIQILERTRAHERWRPAYEALKAAQAGSADYLRRVAPEVRTVAERILREIKPELFSESEAVTSK